MKSQFSLAFNGWCSPEFVAAELERSHYLGAAHRGVAWRDEFGILVMSPPTSRRLPPSWLELTRWCLTGEKNAGSRQWSSVVPRIAERFPLCTTVVSYSDPAVGHTGALYRASGWEWAPTWHRLRPPPTGNGSWSGGRVEAVKDRWVFLLREDRERMVVLAVNDESIVRRLPWCQFSEPLWRKGRPVQDKGRMAAWKRWAGSAAEKRGAA